MKTILIPLVLVSFCSNTQILWSTHEVISRLKSGSSSAKNLVELNPSFQSREHITVNGIKIQAISMTHDGKGFEHIQSLAFLIENGKKYYILVMPDL